MDKRDGPTLMYCGDCRVLHRVEVLAYDGDGFPSRVKWTDDHDFTEAKERAITGMLEHGAAALAIALGAGDWDRAQKVVNEVLSVNDPKD